MPFQVYKYQSIEKHINPTDTIYFMQQTNYNAGNISEKVFNLLFTAKTDNIQRL